MPFFATFGHFEGFYCPITIEARVYTGNTITGKLFSGKVRFSHLFNSDPLLYVEFGIVPFQCAILISNKVITEVVWERFEWSILLN